MSVIACVLVCLLICLVLHLECSGSSVAIGCDGDDDDADALATSRRPQQTHTHAHICIILLLVFQFWLFTFFCALIDCFRGDFFGFITLIFFAEGCYFISFPFFFWFALLVFGKF
uniref:(northern house mosquito) hypothetical protein n=1 Tax=Culex pipiens TaxID=7175 RepID=A0A8D8DE39_CULPI